MAPDKQGPGGGGGGRGGGGGARQRDPGDEAGSEALQLEVAVDGRLFPLSDDDWLALDVLAVGGDEGRGDRDAISLRTLAVHVAGPGARVTRVIGAGDVEVVITPGAWDDHERVPVLRLNRRGRFKFHWIGLDLAPLPGDEVRFVGRLVIESASTEAQGRGP